MVYAVLAGLLLAASFPRLNMAWLAWVAPALILWAAQSESGTKIFRAGYLSGLGYCLSSLYWLVLAPSPLAGWAAYLGLSGVLALFLASWCWVCWRMWQYWTGDWSRISLGRSLAWPALCAAAWVTMEMGLAHLGTGFPWNLLGTSQYRVLPLIQIASVTGVYGVSFVVVWVSISGLVCLSLLLHKPAPFLPVLGQIAPLCLVVPGVFLFGNCRITSESAKTPELKVALVQPAIPPQTTLNPNEATNCFARLLAFSRVALAAKPDLLVWPEMAVPETIARTTYTQKGISDLLRSGNAWLVMGATDARRTPAPSGDWLHSNTAFLTDSRGTLRNYYDKLHLVPFAEYMPGARQFPRTLAKLRTSSPITPGGREAEFQLDRPRAKFPVLISLEDIFPHQVRRRVSADTDFILNLSANGWFGESAGQWQHATGALFRAVENGVPFVRCANTGLSCWIDARGRMWQIYFPNSRNVYQAGVKYARIPLHRPDQGRTVYNRFGDWWGWSCGAVTSMMLVGSFFVEKKTRNTAAARSIVTR